MKQGTKQRIVGSVVLLSLALIFLPIIFDGQGSYQAPVSSRIPEPPSIPALAEPEPVRPEIRADSSTANLEPEPDGGDNGQDQPAAPPPTANSVDAPVDGTTSAADIAAVEPEPGSNESLPTFDAAGLPEGWSVRLGSFSEARNAANLMQRLQDSGYKAYTRSNDNGELTIVYVGPWLERSRADDYLAQLQEEFQLSGMVVRYEIQQL